MTQIDLLLSALHDRSVEIERLIKERDDAREQAERWEDDALRLMEERNEALGELRKAETECSMLRVECGVIAKERDEARRIAKEETK